MICYIAIGQVDLAPYAYCNTHPLTHLEKIKTFTRTFTFDIHSYLFCKTKHSIIYNAVLCRNQVLRMASQIHVYKNSYNLYILYTLCNMLRFVCTKRVTPDLSGWKKIGKENWAEVRFKPATSGLQVQCSTIWAIQPYDAFFFGQKMTLIYIFLSQVTYQSKRFHCKVFKNNWKMVQNTSANKIIFLRI